jgi:hypothetical protein
MIFFLNGQCSGTGVSMVKAWQKKFQTAEQQKEFEVFFKEFENFKRHWPDELPGGQAAINQFVMSQLILLRNEVKQLKKEVSNGNGSNL